MRAVDGVCHVFAPHTTAGIIVNENADPDVCRDFIARFDELVPSNGSYHHAEGNAHAHIKATLAEFDGPRERTVVVTVVRE